MDRNEKIREQLNELAEEKYRNFSASLTPGKVNILGVRLPLLRKLAKQIVKGDWRSYLMEATDDSMEEALLQGMVIGYCDAEPKEVLELAKTFIPKIDCWPVCDSFCGGLKLTDKNKELVWEFLQPYFASEQEYEIRFGVVMLLHYLLPEYAPLAFAHFDRIKQEGYYVKMAVAWVLSMYYVRFPEVTMSYLKDNRLDKFTYNKTLQKITESLKVDKETKALIKGMKR
jgi:3-methyladenine DNA glycosylase AlkD